MKKLVVFAFIVIVWLIIDLWFINADTKEILVPYYLEPTDKEKKRVEDEKAKAKQDAIDAKKEKKKEDAVASDAKKQKKIEDAQRSQTSDKY